MTDSDNSLTFVTIDQNNVKVNGVANSYVVNGIRLNSRVDDIIIGDPEGTAHVNTSKIITIRRRQP